MPIGQGLPSLATLMFNRQVWGIMPVFDCKPTGQYCDDDHHSKLVDRQGKNDNDTSPLFSNIPIGSAVAVQLWGQQIMDPWDNSRYGQPQPPWQVIHYSTHKNGRCISRNRWPIKPTTVTADMYLQHQSNKQSNIKTDPLAEILNNIKRNPAIYTTRQVSNINNTSEQCNDQTTNKIVQEEADIEQYNKKADSSQERGTGSTCDKRTSLQENKVNRTRSRCIVRKPDRLTYI